MSCTGGTVTRVNVMCSIVSPLPASSLWGQDGDLDNLPNNCTDITNTACQLPPALVTALQTNFTEAIAMRTASVARGRSSATTTLSSSGTQFQCPAGFSCTSSITYGGARNNIVTGASITSITPCIAGNVCATASESIFCPAGYYCPGGVANPKPCPTTGTTGCTAGCSKPIACTSGKFCPEGSTAETDCPAGYYCTTPSVKFACPFGTYSSSTGRTLLTACTKCVAGQQCAEGSSSQTPCTAGNYCPSGTGLQKPCPEGHYCADPAVNPPNKCPAGVQCPAGTSIDYGRVCTGNNQRPNTMYTACVQCPALPPGAIYKTGSGCDIVMCTGNKQPDANKTACVACPTPKAGYIWGSAQGCSEIQCPIGMVPSSSRTTCKPV